MDEGSGDQSFVHNNQPVAQTRKTNTVKHPSRLFPRRFPISSAISAAALYAAMAPVAVLAQALSFDIAAQSLDATLSQIARQAGVQLILQSDLVRGRQAPAVQGALDLDAALARALAGSGLEAVRREGAVVVRRAQTDGATLAEVRVTAQAQRPGDLPEAYAGGQVARGGQVGVLGNRDFMETPLTQSSYTAALMEDQQIHHIADVLNNDPTARATNSASTGLDGFSVRGFDVSNADLLFNGMSGVAPTFYNSVMAEAIERVEVLKGPNAMLNGAALFGSVGGAINLIPKRAGDEPLTRFTLGHVSDTQLGGHLDLGRRFGADKQFGVRFNGVHRDGDTAIHNQSRKSGLFALGLDYRGERLRLSSDLGHQDQDMRGTRRFARVAAGVPVPKAPDNHSNFYDPHEFNDTQALYGTVRAEYDLSDQWTAYAGFGGNQRRRHGIGTNRTIVNAQGEMNGDANPSRLGADRFSSQTLEAGVHGRFASGAVQHQMSLSYSVSDMKWRRVSGPPAGPGFPASNIYNPIYAASPDFSLQPDPDDAKKSWHPENSSVTLADTLSMLNERVQLTLGVRRQNIRSTSFDTATGALSGTPYDENATTPMVGLLVKPWRYVSLYGSYVEGLKQGVLVGESFSNEGEVFPPFKTKQREAGAKFDFGSTAITVSVYQIAQPSTIQVDSPTPGEKPALRLAGEQRHRGLDFNGFGEVAKGVRLLGGAAYIDSRLTRTQGGANDGNTGVAAPEWRVVAGTEWDAPFLAGLTLSGRIVHTGSQYLDQANTQRIPAWTRLDIGVRYRIKRAGGKAVMLRANLANALGKSHWDSDPFGQLVLSDPRTLSLSATFDF